MVIILSLDLTPAPLSSSSAPQSPHESQGNTLVLSQDNLLAHCPCSVFCRDMLPQIFMWQVPSCHPNFSSRATAFEKLNLTTQLLLQHLEFLHPYIYHWVFSCLFLSVCCLFTLKCNHPKKGGLSLIYHCTPNLEQYLVPGEDSVNIC